VISSISIWSVRCRSEGDHILIKSGQNNWNFGQNEIFWPLQSIYFWLHLIEQYRCWQLVAAVLAFPWATKKRNPFLHTHTRALKSFFVCEMCKNKITQRKRIGLVDCQRRRRLWSVTIGQIKEELPILSGQLRQLCFDVAYFLRYIRIGLGQFKQRLFA